MNFPTERILRIAIAVVAMIGIGVATYIFIADSTAGAPTCLVGGGGCETVAKSSYSHIAGINIAIFGIIGWVLILGSTFFGNDYARLGGFLVALGGFGFSIYLTYLQIWNIEAICPWCVSDAVLMTIVFALNITRLLGYVGTPDGGAVIGRGAGAGTARPVAEDG